MKKKHIIFLELFFSIKAFLTVMYLVMVSYLDLNYMAMVQEWNLIQVLVELKTNTRLVLMLKGYVLFIICYLIYNGIYFFYLQV